MPSTGKKCARQLVTLFSTSYSVIGIDIKDEIEKLLKEIEALPQEEIDSIVNDSHPKQTLLTALFSRLPPSFFDSEQSDYIHLLMQRLTDPSGKFKADINQLDKNGVAALHLATNAVGYSDSDSTVLLAMLLDNPKIDTSISSKKPQAATMVSLAARSKSFALIKELVERGFVKELFEQQDKKNNLNCTYFQTQYLYPQNGRLRQFLEDATTEATRISRREGGAPLSSAQESNFDFYYNRYALKMLFAKKEDGDKNFSQMNIYKEDYPSSTANADLAVIAAELQSQKAKVESNADNHIQRITSNESFDEESKTKQLAALEEEKAEMMEAYQANYESKRHKIYEKSGNNQEVVLERHKGFSKIMADPREFLAKTREEQQSYIVENFKDNYAPDLEDLLTLLEEKAEVLETISAARTEVEKVKEMKMQGHRLGLKGKFDYQNEMGTESYEGMSVYNTALSISQRVYQFNNVVQNKSTSPYVNTEVFTEPEKKAMQIVEDSFKELDKAFDSDNYLEQARRYKKDLPIIIPCHWEDHMASAVLYKDKLYISNKGWGSFVPSITCYQINIDKLLYYVDEQGQKIEKTPSQLAETIQKLSTENRPKKPWYNAAGDMLASNLDLPELKALEPKKVYQRRLQGQKQGNCAYTNVKRAADAILMALKDDANNMPKNNEGELVDGEQKQSNEFKEIDNVKIFKGLTRFDRLQGIDESIARYQSTKDIMYLDPLFQYLATKPGNSHKNSISIAQHIVQNLQALPEMGEGKWEQHVNQRKYLPSLISAKFSDGLQHIENVLFKKGERRSHLNRLFFLSIPGGQRYTRNRALVEAGMKPETLPRSNLQTLISWVNNPLYKSAQPKPANVEGKILSEKDRAHVLEKEEALSGNVSPLYTSKKENEENSMGQVSSLYIPKNDNQKVENAMTAKPLEEKGSRRKSFTPGFGEAKHEGTLSSPTSISSISSITNEDDKSSAKKNHHPNS